ncbi:HAD family hydrolase [Kitasatospora sp. NPDC048365]|uniref:HAD family hydrolase n=1 Tax=Kitasatospora sp. NPDC048365 TaxID=3364050 RepID=UPI00371CC8E3
MPLTIAAVSFDADDTLWDFDSGFRPAMEYAVRRLDEVLGVAHTLAGLEAVREEMTLAMPGAGYAAARRASFVETVRRAGGAPGLGDAVYEEFVEVRAGATRLFPETREVLAALGARLPLALTTNGTADLAWFGLQDVFAVVTRGAECGIHKPDPGIYRVTAQRLAVPVGAVLHVGDHPVEDVDAARAAGMQAVLLDRTGVAAGAIDTLTALLDLAGGAGRS